MQIGGYLVLRRPPFALQASHRPASSHRPVPPHGTPSRDRDAPRCGRRRSPAARANPYAPHVRRGGAGGRRHRPHLRRSPRQLDLPLDLDIESREMRRQQPFRFRLRDHQGKRVGAGDVVEVVVSQGLYAVADRYASRLQACGDEGRRASHPVHEFERAAPDDQGLRRPARLRAPVDDADGTRRTERVRLPWSDRPVQRQRSKLVTSHNLPKTYVRDESDSFCLELW